MKRSLIGAALAMTIVASGLITWTLGSASGAGYNRATMTCAKGGWDVRYFRKQVDSIVSYGQPVSAHMHDFYGRVDISSTMGAPIPIAPGHEDDPGYKAPAFDNCATYGDWAAYWFPSPKFNGAFTNSGMLTVTLQAPAGVPVVAFPFGENFVAGDSHSTGPNPDPHVAFTCGNIDVTYTVPTDCTGVPGGVVTAQVTFPDCWDGKVGYTYPPGTASYDTPTGLDPKHFSYSVDGQCKPGSVPCVPGQRIAQLITQQQFIDPRTGAPMVNPNNADGTLGLSFASGPYYTYHADYINTWNHVLGDIVNACLNNTPCPTSVNNIAIQ
jgi:hypothetical protein